MNAVEKKVMQMYEEFMATHRVNNTQSIALNVLTRDYGTTFKQEDCVFITKDGKQFLYGTQCVGSISEVLSLCSQVDFLPSDYESRAKYEDELEKYAESVEDENYYFPQTRFGFNIIDIISIHAFPAQDCAPITGRSEDVVGGVRYYGESSEYGEYYKNLNAVYKREGICYIAETSFSEDTNEGEDFLLLTPNNVFKLIDMGGVETYESGYNQTRDLVYATFPALRKFNNFDLIHKFIHKTTAYIFKEIDGQCFGTFLEQMDLHEDLRMFYEEEFVEFAKKRIAADKDNTDIDDSLAERLFGFLGNSCYMRRNFVPTDWDTLIDKWEDEPNYCYIKIV